MILQKLKILFRCDGSQEIGLGHVIRCLALADELRGVYKCHVTFAMRKSELGINMVQNKKYPVILPSNYEHEFNYENWLLDCINKTKANVLILDSRDNLDRNVLKKIKQFSDIRIVTIDDPEDKRLEADLAFYPPVPQLKRVSWEGFSGELYFGWKYVILRKEFSRKYASPKNNIPVVLVTMGGTDPAGLTLQILEALDSLHEEFITNVLIGPGFIHSKQLEKFLNRSNRTYQILHNINNVGKIMSQSDFSIASFGVTAYELAAIGIPSILLSLTKDHEESASIFDKNQIEINLGVYKEVNTDLIIKKVNFFLNNRELLIKYRNNLQKIDIGIGVKLIAKKIINS